MSIPDEVDDLPFQATSLSHSTEHSHASIRHAQRRLRATGLSVEKILEAMTALSYFSSPMSQRLLRSNLTCCINRRLSCCVIERHAA